jgi:hypothetical protein
MGTKNNPGRFDCYAAAKPDEPMFILLGRDPVAAGAARAWANEREKLIDAGVKPESDRDMIVEARQCADAMEAYGIARAQAAGKPFPGICSKCRCTEIAACRHDTHAPDGCGWANDSRTICTMCDVVEVDQVVLVTMMVGLEREIPIAVIEGWTQDERRAARAYCWAVMLKASDNEEVIVPTRPEILAPFAEAAS